MRIPWTPLTYFVDGEGGSSLTEVLYPKRSLLFLAYPKNSLSPFFATQKSPFVFFATPKNPGIFHRPQKITFGQNFRPQKIISTPPPTPPSLKYVSGAPGMRIGVIHVQCMLSFFCFDNKSSSCVFKSGELLG